jgi:hypothetical protein
MKKIYISVIFLLLLSACSKKLLVDKSDVVFKKSGYILFDYKNKIYFIETDPALEFGTSRYKTAFPIANFRDSASANFIYIHSKPMQLLEPGSTANEIQVRVTPVTVRYNYEKALNKNDETLVFKNGKVVVFPYYNLRELKIIDIDIASNK